MDTGFTIIWIIALIFLAFIPANMAKKKGYSFGGFWLFGFFFWLIAVIVAACLRDKTRDQANVPPQSFYPPASYQPPAAPPVYGAAPIQPPNPGGPQPPPEKFCPYCGNKYAGDKTTCDSCGARI